MLRGAMQSFAGTQNGDVTIDDVMNDFNPMF